MAKPALDSRLWMDLQISICSQQQKPFTHPGIEGQGLPGTYRLSSRGKCGDGLLRTRLDPRAEVSMGRNNSGSGQSYSFCHRSWWAVSMQVPSPWRSQMPVFEVAIVTFQGLTLMAWQPPWLIPPKSVLFPPDEPSAVLQHL